ncbi:MAG: response regulator [Acidobacteria bacterium]|nr:response regulator [Acidobacteriota bacterium]
MTTFASKLSPETVEFQENRSTLLQQKNELLEEITGAIAHQFNNIMMAITSYAELELKEANPTQKRNLEQVLSHATRATTLIQNLLAFNRKPAPEARPVSLNHVVSDIQDLLQQLAGERIRLSLQLNQRVHAICADPVELQELLLSLVLTARSTMASNGEIDIATSPVELDEDFLGADDHATPGKYVMLSVSDSGPAASPRGPYVDTKSDPALRVKYSLAIVRSVVKRVNGLMRISASPQKGSCYKIYFPAQPQPGTGMVETQTIPRNLPLAKTVLVVEDDDAVRIPAAEFLKMEGFKVLQAKGGLEAIEMMERNRCPLDLLITDMVMPRMGGQEVAEKFLAIYPDLKVLYMSGDQERVLLPPASAHRSAVLQKPFRLNRLNEKIHDLLSDFLLDALRQSPGRPASEGL